jgi:hypothetical protein
LILSFLLPNISRGSTDASRGVFGSDIAAEKRESNCSDNPINKGRDKVRLRTNLPEKGAAQGGHRDKNVPYQVVEPEHRGLAVVRRKVHAHAHGAFVLGKNLEHQAHGGRQGYGLVWQAMAGSWVNLILRRFRPQPGGTRHKEHHRRRIAAPGFHDRREISTPTQPQWPR